MITRAEQSAPSSSTPSPSSSSPQGKPAAPVRIKKTPNRDLSRMFFPSSGHNCFELITLNKEKFAGVSLPTKSVMLQMLKRECHLRLSDEYQFLFTFFTNDEHRVTDVIDMLQLQVVREFGYDDVDILRSAQSLFPGDKDIIDAAFYIKYNRCRQGEINEGDLYEDVPLLRLNGSSTSLNKYFMDTCKRQSLPHNSPFIVVAGSIS